MYSNKWIEAFGLLAGDRESFSYQLDSGRLKSIQKLLLLKLQPKQQLKSHTTPTYIICEIRRNKSVSQASGLFESHKRLDVLQFSTSAFVRIKLPPDTCRLLIAMPDLTWLALGNVGSSFQTGYFSLASEELPLFTAYSKHPLSKWNTTVQAATVT